MPDRVSKSYRLLPNPDVYSGKVRLRSCSASRAAKILDMNKVHPAQVREYLNKHTVQFKIISESINPDQLKFEYRFSDFSYVSWIQELGKYAVGYPEICRVVYMPISMPSYKDQLSISEKSEIDLVMEVEAHKQKRASRNPDEDEVEERLRMMGCG